MNTIKRDVYVLRNTIKIPIEVTKGTDMVGIEFTVRDFDIPATAAAVAYSYNRKMKKPNSQLCDVKGNVISFTHGREFFEVGMNELQIRVINEDKALISFKEKVKCSDAMGFPDDEEEKQQTLIEQLVSNIGKETGERKKADETERNERTAAIEKEKSERTATIEKEKSERTQADATEKSERKAEIDVERKRIDNLAKLPAGSTTGDAELKDIRVGADGTIYGTAGEAVRQQVGSLKEDLGSVICPYVKILNGDRTLKELHIPVGTKFRIETLNGENFGVTTTLRLLDSSKNEIDYYSIYKDTKYRDVVNNFDRDIHYVKLGSGDGINDFRVVAYISDKLFTRVCKLESNEIALLQLQNVFNKMATILIPNEYLRNGSIPNALNTEVVATRLIFTKAKSIKVATDRPNTDGFVYVYSYATSSGICFDLNNNDNYRKGYIDYGEPPHYNDEYESWNDGENYGIQIAIGEYDAANKKYNQLRVTDFDGYKIYVFDTTAMKNSLRLKSTEERLDLIEKGYPAFYDSYIVDRIETVKSKDILIGNSGDSFVFITDMHDQNNYYSPFLAKKICDSTSVKRIIYGGDYENEPSSKESAVSLLTTRRNKCMVKDDVIFLRGNHDTNPYGKGTLTEAEFYSIFEKHIEKHINTNKNTYFYNDNESQKIRYLFVDSGVNGSISDVQKNWIKINAGSLNSDWTVIAFMHHGIYTDDKDDRTNIKVYPSLTSVKEALANVSCKIACIICGHTHIDLSDTSGKYPIICTTCDAHGIQASSMSSDNRDANTINEQAFDVFHVDTVNQKVYATRIGGGKNDVREDKKFELNDREFSYS